MITGAGRAFCSGLDLKVFTAPDADRSTVSALIHRFGRITKPLIGAVNGPAVTGGFELALGCDFLIGSHHAMFADTHATIGAFRGGGMTARLVQVPGVRSAKAVSLAGLRLDAEAPAMVSVTRRASPARVRSRRPPPKAHVREHRSARDQTLPPAGLHLSRPVDRCRCRPPIRRR